MSLSFEPYDVWLCRFAFADKPHVKKVRPGAVIDVDGERLSLVLAKITSHAPRLDSRGEIEVQDLESAGLVMPSVIRCSQIVNAGNEDMIKRIGRLADSDIQRLLDGLEAAGFNL